MRRPRLAPIDVPLATAVRSTTTLTSPAARLAPTPVRPASVRSALTESPATAPAFVRPWRRPIVRTASQAARATTRGWARGGASQAARATVAGSGVRRRAFRRAVIPLSSRSDELVWQPRFIYTTAAVILVAFMVVALPLWVALYRMAGAADADPAEIVSLAMMLLGGFLSSAAAWVLIVELRARARMAEALAQAGAHEAPGTAGRAVASGLVRPFGQVWPQVALLVVALSLFVGATIVSG